jgi:hypothetical protein
LYFFHSFLFVFYSFSFAREASEKFFFENLMEDLSIIQKTYDLIVWYVPILNRLPRDHKFLLGDRLIAGLYDLLEHLIDAQYAKVKVAKLQALNPKLSILRRQTRLLLDFGLIKSQRYEYAAKQ